MTKFTAPSPEQELSHARRRLADRQRQLADVDAAIKVELDHAARLDDIHKAVGPAQSALAHHDAQNAAGFAAWARGDVTGKPTTDAAHRAELAAELANAEAASASATIAQEQFRHASNRAAAPRPRLQIEIDEARRLVVLEDASELFAPIADSVATYMRLHKELNVARSAAMAGVEFGEGRFLEFGAALGKFDADRRKAEAVPREAPPEDRTIPGAQMAAEMARTLSFPTTSIFR
jgi:hypothetical protein